MPRHGNAGRHKSPARGSKKTEFVIPAPAARHAKFKRKSPIKTFFKILLTALLVLLVGGGTVLAYAYYNLMSQVEIIDIELPVEEELQEPEEKKERPIAVPMKKNTIDGAYNMLIIGSDSRQGQSFDDGEQSVLNDVTMLVSIDEGHTRADIISFPRDLMIDYECTDPTTGAYSGFGPKMINAALTLGGPSCVSKVVSELTGEAIDSAVIVNFDSVMHLTTAVGGIPMCFSGDVRNQNSVENEILFHAGPQNLQGWDALVFLRERKGFGNGGDTGRVENQKLFIQSFLSKMHTENIFTNPAKMYELATISIQNLTMTEDLTNPERLVSLANTVAGIPQQNITLHTAPNYTHPANPNRLALDTPGLAAMVAEMNTPKPLTPAVETPAVAILKDSVISQVRSVANMPETEAERMAREADEVEANAKAAIDNPLEGYVYNAPYAYICE